jgi:hypothetical protein
MKSTSDDNQAAWQEQAVTMGDSSLNYALSLSEEQMEEVQTSDLAILETWEGNQSEKEPR